MAGEGVADDFREVVVGEVDCDEAEVDGGDDDDDDADCGGGHGNVKVVGTLKPAFELVDISIVGVAVDVDVDGAGWMIVVGVILTGCDDECCSSSMDFNSVQKRLFESKMGERVLL
jgi:hypothetical protein